MIPNPIQLVNNNSYNIKKRISQATITTTNKTENITFNNKLPKPYITSSSYCDSNLNSCSSLEKLLKKVSTLQLKNNETTKYIQDEETINIKGECEKWQSLISLARHCESLVYKLVAISFVTTYTIILSLIIHPRIMGLPH